MERDSLVLVAAGQILDVFFDQQVGLHTGTQTAVVPSGAVVQVEAKAAFRPALNFGKSDILQRGRMFG